MTFRLNQTVRTKANKRLKGFANRRGIVIRLHEGEVGVALQGSSFEHAIWFRPSDLEPATASVCSREARNPQVYVIGAVGSKRVKVGYSTRPDERLKALQCGSPLTLQILATGPGDENTEIALHERLSQYRSHGEWFEMPPRVLASLILDVYRGVPQ